MSNDQMGIIRKEANAIFWSEANQRNTYIVNLLIHV
jgi:hypothetical protein